MSQIHLTTRNNDKVVIQLLDNPFITDFVEQLKFVKDHFVMNSWREYIPFQRSAWNAADVKKQEQDFISAITALNEMGLNFPVPVEEIVLDNSDRTRQLLNRLHRHFTTSHRSFSHNEPTTWMDGTDLTFTVEAKDRERFAHEVHNINTAVHNTEKYFINDRIRNFPQKSEYQILFESTQPLDSNNNPQNLYFKPIKQEHFKYFSDELKYDAWLPIHQIQGKNYWVAYFDMDDPTHWDVSTNVMYTGSFAIGDRSAIRQPEILEYLKSYGMTPGPLECGMPLGNIIEGKEFVDSLMSNDVVNIEVYE